MPSLLDWRRTLAAFVAVSMSAALDGVASARGSLRSMMRLDLPPQLSRAAGSSVAVQDVPMLDDSTTLTSGRLPTATGELTIDATLAEQQGLAVGNTIKLTNSTGDDNTPANHSSSTIVGVISPGPGYGGRERTPPSPPPVSWRSCPRTTVPTSCWCPG